MMVKPGEKIPTDGLIIKGESAVDESIATGESLPIHKSKGDNAIGATINLDGSIEVEATKIGKDTFISQMAKLVEEAQTTKIPIQAFADQVTAIFVPIVIGFGNGNFYGLENVSRVYAKRYGCVCEYFPLGKSGRIPRNYGYIFRRSGFGYCLPLCPGARHTHRPYGRER